MPFYRSILSSDNQGLPSGAVQMYAGATAPSGWLMCDGSIVGRDAYPSLFNSISVLYGSGDGSTTFNLPDLRGRSIVGLGTNASVNALALSDGVAVADRRPQHKHNPHQHTPETATNFATNSGNAYGAWTNGGTILYVNGKTNLVDGGSGNANDSLDAPAFLVMNYIIKT